MTPRASAVYLGRLAHARRRGVRHAFAYDVAMLYLDLEELPALLAGPGPLRAGRFGLLSFCRADYLGGAGDLAEAARAEAARQLGIRPAGPVRLLTTVRVLGRAFNPVSFYYLYGADGSTLEAVVAEVTNTPWNERHAYALRAGPGGARAALGKRFHVSPFQPLQQDYAWRLTAPGERLAVDMRSAEGGEEVFHARLTLRRRPWSAAALWGVAARVPAQGWKALLAIHWEALRLWWKGAPVHDHPSTAARAARRKAA